MTIILNPYTQKELLVPHEGTRILQQDFGLIGGVLVDPYDPRRFWQVQSLYTPLRERVLGGIRAKLMDEKNFVTFATQMDLEVMIGYAKPGEKCKWSGKTYESPGDSNFCGLCADEQDLLDDLYDRELALRAQSPTGVIQQSTDMFRRIHMDHDMDVEEYLMLFWDGDLDTGVSPDLRMTTLTKRWNRVERVQTNWDYI